MQELMLIGTAHVIDLSFPLEKHIRNFNPDLVALELDKQRWYALKANTKSTQGPFYLRILASLQKYISDSFGSSPGAEMMVATKIAGSLGSKLAFIDKPVIQTIQEAWKTMPWNEFFQLFKDSMISFVGGGDFSIDKSIRTGDFSNELKQFSLQYPTLKSKLIDSRDIYMSKNIVKLFREHNCERIVAVIGEGHIDGISSLLHRLNPRIVRLRDLLQNTGNSVSFSIEI